MLTTVVIEGLDRKPHFAVVAVKQPAWPLALCGPTEGALANQSKAEADLFADVGAMVEQLRMLASEVGSLNPMFPVGEGKLANMKLVAERANATLARHGAVLKRLGV